MNSNGNFSTAAINEMRELGIIDVYDALRPPLPRKLNDRVELVPMNRISADAVLNEAFSYMKPSSFSRATTFEIADTQILLISGTASVGSGGETVHPDDFNAQQWRTYRNITELLNQNQMTWHNVVWTSNYLRDIDRDYDKFNTNRTKFYTWLGLQPLPASLGVQAQLCRSDLLVEISAVAIAKKVSSD